MVNCERPHCTGGFCKFPAPHVPGQTWRNYSWQTHIRLRTLRAQSPESKQDAIMFWETSSTEGISQRAFQALLPSLTLLFSPPPTPVFSKRARSVVFLSPWSVGLQHVEGSLALAPSLLSAPPLQPSPGPCPPTPRLSSHPHSPSHGGTPELAESQWLPIVTPLPAGRPMALTRQLDSLWDLLVSCPGIWLSCSWNGSFGLSRPAFAATTHWDTEIGLSGGPGAGGGAGLDSAPPRAPQCHQGRLKPFGAMERKSPEAPVGPSFYPNFWAFHLGE